MFLSAFGFEFKSIIVTFHFEALKELTRGVTHINQESMHRFIDTLHIKEEIKKELKKITPHNYVGKA